MNNVSLFPYASQIPEDEDIKLIAKHDSSRAIDLIVRKYRDKIFRHALYVVKDYQEAVDVTQEVFIKAMRENRFFEDEFKMKAWLFRVTSNLCFNIVRDRKRRGGILDRMVKVNSIAPDQISRIRHNQRQQNVLSKLEKLNEKHREILYLRYYSDLSYAEIAETLDIQLGTVMSRLSRAKCRLMEVIGNTGVDLG
jgi:RNA polymerase sigma-70 factor (ECF subfamily)